MNENSYSYIMLKNLAYKTYFDISKEDFERVFKDFQKCCEHKNVLIVGDINFAVTQIDLKKRMNLDVFASVDRAFSPSNELKYRTYFCLNMLLQGRIETNNFIEEEIELLEEMNNFAKRENLTFISPYYHTFKYDRKGEKGWCEIKAKVYEND